MDRRESNMPERVSFQTLQGKIDGAILSALQAAEYETMSPVQAKVMEMLPHVHSDW